MDETDVAPDPAAGDAVGAAADPHYMYKPSMLGAPWEFALRREGLEWRYGRHSGLVRYDRIERVRMAYRPVTLQSHRFVTEIWSRDTPKISIASTSWRSLVEQERLDAAYRAFIGELHRRLAAAGTSARFSSGMPLAVYGLGVAVFAALTGVMIVLAGRAALAGDWAGAALVAGFLALFGWQVGNFFRRNQPRRYRPEALPEAVLPRVKP